MTATVMGGLGSASRRHRRRRDRRRPRGGQRLRQRARSPAPAPSGPACSRSPRSSAGSISPRGRVEPFTPRPLKPGPRGPGASTTLAIVATDVALDKAAARRLAEVAHGGLARAIYPAHTPFDGDLVFAVSTGTRPPGPEPALEALVLAHAAALCLTRAIARGVHAARPAPGNLLPCWSELGE